MPEQYRADKCVDTWRRTSCYARRTRECLETLSERRKWPLPKGSFRFIYTTTYVIVERVETVCREIGGSSLL